MLYRCCFGPGAVWAGHASTLGAMTSRATIHYAARWLDRLKAALTGAGLRKRLSTPDLGIGGGDGHLVLETPSPNSDSSGGRTGALIRIKQRQRIIQPNARLCAVQSLATATACACR